MLFISEQKRWELLKTVAVEKSENIVSMLSEGYTITNELLELLLYLDHKDTLLQITEKFGSQLTPRQRNRMIEVFGDKVVADAQSKGEKAQKEAEQAALEMQKLEAERKRTRFDLLLAQGTLSKELLREVASLNSQEKWDAVLAKFGNDAVYEEILALEDEDTNESDDTEEPDELGIWEKFFPLEFILAKENFLYISHCVDGKKPEEIPDYCALIAAYDNGPKALKYCRCPYVTRWLCENGYRGIFVDKADIFHLIQVGCLDFDSWQLLYRLDRKSALAALKQVTRQRSFKVERKKYVRFLLLHAHFLSIMKL